MSDLLPTPKRLDESILRVIQENFRRLADKIDKLTRNVNANRLDWHYVGETGEPSFENSWVNWNVNNPPTSNVDYGSLRFAKRNGLLYIEGGIEDGTDNEVFQLPDGYLPLTNQRVPCVTYQLGQSGFTGFNFGFCSVEAKEQGSYFEVFLLETEPYSTYNDFVGINAIFILDEDS